MKTKCSILIILMLCVFCVKAQENKESLRLAEYWEKNNDLQAAAFFYNEYIKSEANVELEVYFKYGEALRKTYRYDEAEIIYEKLIKADIRQRIPQSFFWLGMVKKNIAKYSEALTLFETYYNIKKQDNDLLTRRAKLEISACKEAIFLLSDTLPIRVEKLSSKINTEHSEFNAMQMGDTLLYFSALRPETFSEHNAIIDDYYSSKIYETRFTINGFSVPKPITKLINNPNYHNANFCFNSSKTKMYFSRSNVNKGILLQASIWVSEYRNGKWEKPYQLPKIINHPNATTTQPCIVRTEQHEILYFVSDRPGGIGNLDIWYSVITNGSYGQPINLGSNINTPENEVTPFYHVPTGTLYFSSDWHEGMGGYDIFKAKGSMSYWQDPENMGFPINTSANDIYFVINEVDDDGYFASNRLLPLSMKDATCCNSIFSYEWQKEKKIEKTDTLLLSADEEIMINVSKILPITLYFHNDEPNPRSRETTTKKDYKTTLDEYFTLLSLYREEYASGLAGEKKEKAVQEIDNFFRDYVQKGFDLLEQFSSYLLADLERGKKVEITIEGFASPLFSDDYNMNLSLRRIESLKNYLKIYKNGILRKYLDDNSLVINTVPRGKRTAKPYVSDNPNDKRNSIYSISAALERRIQITGFEEIETEEELLAKKQTLVFPDTIFTFSKEKDVTNYTKCIEFGNFGKERINIKSIRTDIKSVQAKASRNIIPPHEKAFLCFSFPASVFGTIDSMEVIIETDKKNFKLMFYFGN